MLDEFGEQVGVFDPVMQPIKVGEKEKEVGMCSYNNLSIILHFKNLSPHISVSQHSFLHTTPDCVGRNKLPHDQKLCGKNVGKSTVSSLTNH